MPNEQLEQKQKLEEFFSPAYLSTLPDPYHVFSKIVEYYAGLTVDEKTAFEDATIAWLEIESTDLTRAQSLQLTNGIRVCGYLKLTRAVDTILAIARRFAPLRDPTDPYQNDLPTIIVLSCSGNLATIGDPRAVEFLREEASHCGDVNPNRANIAAIIGLSEIDLGAALDFLPLEIHGDILYRERRSWVSKHLREFGLIYETLLGLLNTHGRGVIYKITDSLHELPIEKKQFVFTAFKGVMQRPVIQVAGGNVRTDEEKRILITRFAQGLGLNVVS